MFRREFMKGVSLAGAGSLFDYSSAFATGSENVKREDDRTYWLNMLWRITRPVMEALSQDKLKELMPVEAVAGAVEGRKKVTYLEELGRSLACLSPWLELGPDETPEGKLRSKVI